MFYRTLQALEFLLTSSRIFLEQYSSPQAPCFLQHKLCLCYLRVPFQLSSPPRFHVTHIPKGNLVATVYQSCVLFGHFKSFSQAPMGLFSHCRLRARRGPACIPRRKFESRAGSVARALGVQGHGIWLVITGLLCAEIESSKTTENRHVD